MTTFSNDTLAFLHELQANNNRAWFNANKSRYEALVREPALRFIEDIRAPVAGISKQFDVVAKRTGGSLMRVHRDTRFSKDKTPYKTNIGIQFRHKAGKDVHAPGFYVHIGTDAVFLGAGIWHPDSPTLAKIRNGIADNPAHWQKLLKTKRFRNNFELTGAALSQPPRGYRKDHPLVEDLKRTDFIAVHYLDAPQIVDAEFAGRVAKKFNIAAPFVRFLCNAIDLPY